MKQEAIKCGCVGLAIIVTLTASLWVLVPLLDWFDIPAMEDNTVGMLSCLIIAAICAVIAGVYAYLFWKESAIIRRLVFAILGIFIILLGCKVLAQVEELGVFLFFFFGSIFFSNVALLWGNATTKQCRSMFLRTLCAYIPIILSAVLIFAIMILAVFSDSVILKNIAFSSQPLLLLAGLCITVRLLCSVGAELSRYFSSTIGKSVALLLFSIFSCYTIFVLFAIIGYMQYGIP